MKKIIQYEMVSSSSEHTINMEVNDYIKIGFQPYENPFTLSKNGISFFCQAMVKYSE